MKIFITLSFLVHFSFTFGQNEAKIAQILSSPHSTTSRVSCENSVSTTLLSCDFSGSTFDTQALKSTLKNCAVVKIYYVNTTYKSSPTFNQQALDIQRFSWLNAQFPEFFADPFVEWEVVEQTGCSSSEEGRSFFHGFVLVHRRALTEENRNKEIDALLFFLQHPEDGFKEPELDPLVNSLNRPSSSSSKTIGNNKNQKNTFATFKGGEYALFNHFQQNLLNSPGINRDRLDEWVKVTFSVSETGEISNLTFLEDYPLSASDRVKNAFQSMPKWEPETENGQAVPTTIKLDIRVSYSGSVNGMYLRNGVRPDFNEQEVGPSDASSNAGTTDAQNPLHHSGVYVNLSRLDSTKQYALVMDVTGSMGGSTAALLAWIKKHHASSPFSSFSFFNDGNDANSKPIGKTGGIYSTFNIQEVNKTVELAMRKGSGGPEISENDMEAVLKAIEIDSTATDILLIGDNYSDIRDIRLLDQISKPVHVLLCAAPSKIRTEYLDVVKQTGGQLYLNGEIIDLTKVADGETVVIQGFNYVFNGRKFRLVEMK